MATGASSLGVVREELFATMTETQQNLERFLEERDSCPLLQLAVSNLQQIKGILSLIELTGAVLLAQEMESLAVDIPAGADEEHNEQLAAINNGLHVLRSYLEKLESDWVEMPELLLPAINQLRQAGNQSRLPESYFFSVRLNVQRSQPVASLAVEDTVAALARLRHMYQLALLSIIRDANVQPALIAMQRIMQRMERIDPQAAGTSLYWIAAAMLESFVDGKLLMNVERKLLLSRLDREVRQHLTNENHSLPRGLIKDMLYLVALAHSSGPLASEMQAAANLPGLPFTDRLLADEYQRLSGPDSNVMRSLSVAIREELNTVKDTIDLIGRKTVSQEAFENLPHVIGKLEKTLVMIGMTGASASLRQQLKQINQWQQSDAVGADELLELANAVIYIEGLVSSLEKGQRHVNQAEELSESEVFAKQQLMEARVIVRDEARAGLLQAKRAITGYFESDGDVGYLEDIPVILDNVRGGLWFIDKFRTASLVKLTAGYIDEKLARAAQMPPEATLDHLAEALSGLEYYLDDGAALSNSGEKDILDGVEDSLRRLGVWVADDF